MKYTLTIIYFKEVTRNKKMNRETYKVDYYKNLTFDNAKFLAATQGQSRGIRFQNNKHEFAYEKDATNFIAFERNWGLKLGSIAFCYPQKKKRKQLSTDISIYPDFKLESSLSVKMFEWKILENIIKKEDDNFYDYSIEAHNIWGPKSNIPKGYFHVEKGIVEKGDYVWQSSTNSNDHPCFLNVSVSFSPIKIGEKIYKSGALFKSEHRFFPEDYSISYSNYFIIRKKSEK